MLCQCTFQKHGEKKIEQTIFECRSCGLVGDKGICETCYLKCHSRHNAGKHSRIDIDLSDDTSLGKFGTWGEVKKNVMKFGAKRIEQVKKTLEPEVADALIQLIEAQKTQKDMLPLNKVPDYCQCRKVNCEFEQDYFIKAEIDNLL